MVEIIDSVSKYNLWGGNSPFLGFNRHIYQEKVMKSVGNNLVKVVVGQRRVGKSFVLRQVLSQIVAGGVPAENTLYINKEFLEISAIKSAEDLQSLFCIKFCTVFRPAPQHYQVVPRHPLQRTQEQGFTGEAPNRRHRPVHQGKERLGTHA
jgi:hypothetical protein